MEKMKKPKKILFIASFAESLPNFRGHLIRSFTNAGFQVHCAAPELSRHSRVKRELEEWKCICHDLPFNRISLNPLPDLVALLFLTYLILRHRFQIVLGYTIKPIIYGGVVSWLFRVRIRSALVTGLGYSFTEQGGRGYSLTQRIAQHLYRIAMFCSTQVFFQNNDDLNLFLRNRWVKPAKTTLIAGSGVSLSTFQRAPFKQDSPLHFLMIARFLRDKGLLEYVEAAKIVKRKYPTAVFSLAGWLDDNPATILADNLDRWVSEGTINLLGKLEDVRPAIEACSVYVLPSYREGMPRTVLEAMAMGRPVITTDAPGCRDTVVEGENGFLVPIKSSSALAEAMIRFIENPLLMEPMGIKSREFAEQKYDVCDVNETILKILGVTSEAVSKTVPEVFKAPEKKHFAEKEKICIIVSTPMTIQAFLRYHIEMLSKHYDVSIVANFSEPDNYGPTGGSNYDVKIHRKVRLLGDLSALVNLCSFFRQNQFCATLSVTPKAGLVTSLAGVLVGVPVRFHWFTGQIWVTRRGISRLFLKSLDRFVANSCTEVLVDGHSQYEFLKSQGVVPVRKGVVLGKGSISGVDFERFHVNADIRTRVRDELGVSSDDVIILYLGRINRDKGVLDLAYAFDALARKMTNIRFLCVGPDEENLVPIIKQICANCLDRINFKGYTDQPNVMMNASDIFCLPSYREGFGSVVLEAAICGLPSVVSRIYGLEGSVVENKTGLFFEPKNISEIAEKLSILCENKQLRLEMAQAAKERTQKYFSKEDITNELVGFFHRYVPLCDVNPISGKLKQRSETEEVIDPVNLAGPVTPGYGTRTNPAQYRNLSEEPTNLYEEPLKRI